MQICDKFSFTSSVIKNISVAQNFIYSDLSFLYYSSIGFKNISSAYETIMNSFSDVCIMNHVGVKEYYPSFYKQINTTSLIKSSFFCCSKIGEDQQNSLFQVQSNPIFYKVINSIFTQLNTSVNGAVLIIYCFIENLIKNCQGLFIPKCKKSDPNSKLFV